MIDAVRRYDGYIVQSTGDGIFALFGAPVAHEDHPQRALYAALRMQEELRRYSARLREAGSLPLEARVGVNTGEVVVRSITTGARTYRVHSNRAHCESRIADAGARADRVNRDQPSRPASWSRDISRSSRSGRRRVKGVSEPVNVYEVTGLGPLRTRLQRAAGRGLTKFVGREREMEAMRTAAEQARPAAGRSSRRWRRRAPASRGCSSNSRPRINRDGWCSRRSRSRTAKHRHICR